MIFLAFPYRRPLPKGQWAVAYIRATNYHKLILMQVTPKTAVVSGETQFLNSNSKTGVQDPRVHVTSWYQTKLTAAQFQMNKINFASNTG